MFVAGLYQQVRKTPAFMSANFNLVIAYAKVQFPKALTPRRPLTRPLPQLLTFSRVEGYRSRCHLPK